MTYRLSAKCLELYFKIETKTLIDIVSYYIVDSNVFPSIFAIRGGAAAMSK